MRRSYLVIAAAAMGISTIASAVVATDNFESYAASSYLNGQGGWAQSDGATNYQYMAGGGAGGTQGLSPCGPSKQMNWTGNAFDWGTDVPVGQKVIVRMDFQANGSGNFDDDRVGWVMSSSPDSSSYHFGVQLDNSDNGGGLSTYFRDLSGARALNTGLISLATLAPSGSNWYRQQLEVTKLTAALGIGGAQVDVSFVALDGAGNPTGSPLTASYGTIDTSALRGFSGTVYPMFKNFGTQPGNSDNAYFEITAVPEPATLSLLVVGALAMMRRRAD